MSEAMDSAVDNGSKSEQLSDGRFEYTHLYKYLRDGTYPEGFTKAEKSGLRKRAKFFYYARERFILHWQQIQ